MTTTYDFPEPGLYFDAGIRSAGELDQEVIGLAHQYGWEPDDVNLGELTADDEFINEIADDAIEFLNGLETREGYAWGYGENAEGFGLWTGGEDA